MNLKDEWKRFLNRDARHFIVSLGVMSVGFLCYVKFGFYGWKHLILVLLLWYVVLPLDDWFEKERPLPYHAIFIAALIAYFYPLMVVLALLGTGITNLRFLLKKNNFFLEKMESLGNVLVGIAPFILPLHTPPHLIYVAASLFILFADSFHKIGHRETKHIQLTWFTGLFFLLPLLVIFGIPGMTVVIITLVLLASLIPFALLTDKKHSWLYTQIWFGLAGFIGYYYYLFVFLP